MTTSELQLAAPRKRTPQSDLGSPASCLGLQDRASENIRKHWLRTVRRTLILLTADVLSLAGASAVINALTGLGYDSRRLVLASVLGLWISGAYDEGKQRSRIGHVVLGLGIASLIQFYPLIWSSSLGGTIERIGVFIATASLAVLLGRMSAASVMRRYARGVGLARTIVLTDGDAANDAAQRFLSSSRDFNVIGTVRMSGTNGKGGEQFVELSELIQRGGAETMLLWGGISTHNVTQAVRLAIASGCRLLAGPQAADVLVGAAPSSLRSNNVVLTELTAPTRRAWRLAAKRAFDLAATTAGLLIAVPLMAIIAVAIRFDSPGPVLFRQERVGRAGRRFKILKFRTMVHGASNEDHRKYVEGVVRGTVKPSKSQTGKAIYKLVGDSRVTRVGGFLRRYSLDELPQLFNVLNGEMSLVGPRPVPPYEVEFYDAWHLERLQVRPGITGLWQVSGRNLLKHDEMCQLDIHYARNVTIWLDFRILLKTIPVVLFNSSEAE